MEPKTHFTLEEAENYLNDATNGLAKPEEDVVPYGVCQCAHHAIVNYLSVYLMNNGRELPQSSSVEELLTFCREVNPIFNELHLAPYYNPTDTEDVWMNLDTANDFVGMARKTKKMVRQLINQN